MHSALAKCAAALALVLCCGPLAAVAAPATITSPLAGSQLSESEATFFWNDAGASLYQVYVGNTPGAYDIGYFPTAGTTGLAATVTGLPRDGRTLYVRLWSNIAGVYEYTDATFIAATTAPATIISPPDGSTLSGSMQSFQWSDEHASLYQVWVGNSVGTYDIGYYPAEGTRATSTIVTGLPADGRTLHVRLWSNIGGTYYFRDHTYVAAAVANPGASITNYADYSTLPSTTVTFEWNDAGASLYQLWIGDGVYPVAGTKSTSTTVTGLPADGRALHARLWSLVGNTYHFRDYTYIASGSSSGLKASITNYVDGSTLPSADITFRWDDVPAPWYQLSIGNSRGARDLFYCSKIVVDEHSCTVYGLPTDGRTLYVRLTSNDYINDYTFIAPHLAAYMISPPPDSGVITETSNDGRAPALTGATQTFQWTDARASLYQVWVGNNEGAYDIGYYPPQGTTATSTVVTGLPLDGRRLYVRLWSFIDGAYTYRDYTYTAATGVPAVITSPADGGTLAGTAQTFSWSDAGANLYQLWLGTSVGAYDIGYYPIEGTTSTSTNVVGLPADGSVVYARLWSKFGATWYYRDSSYQSGLP